MHLRFQGATSCSKCRQLAVGGDLHVKLALAHSLRAEGAPSFPGVA